MHSNRILMATSQPTAAIHTWHNWVGDQYQNNSVLLLIVQFNPHFNFNAKVGLCKTHITCIYTETWLRYNLSKLKIQKTLIPWIDYNYKTWLCCNCSTAEHCSMLICRRCTDTAPLWSSVTLIKVQLYSDSEGQSIKILNVHLPSHSIRSSTSSAVALLHSRQIFAELAIFFLHDCTIRKLKPYLRVSI